MKIAALSFFSANDAFSARRGPAQSSLNEDYPRDSDRRRKPRVAEAVRVSPASRMATGLAVQVIAQIDRMEAEKPGAERIEAARAAYRPQLPASGGVVNFRA
ncbi:MAG: hypothetical protein ABWZ40_10695 [Caulobacterales bacterium]